MADQFDLLVVSARNNERFGQFVFPKKVLYEKGFVAQAGKGGKRAMRVYPPWNITDSKQAQSTQAWQVQYFFEIQPKLDNALIKKLFQRN